MDQLAIHKNKEIKTKLNQSGIELMILPVASACELSPLDNSLFSQLKSRLRGKTFTDYNQKFSKIQKIINDIKEPQVRRYFQHCGLPFRGSLDDKNTSDLQENSQTMILTEPNQKENEIQILINRRRGNPKKLILDISREN